LGFTCLKRWIELQWETKAGTRNGSIHGVSEEASEGYVRVRWEIFKPVDRGETNLLFGQ
jgi:hypothetical protein